MTITADYSLPDAFRLAPPEEPEELWQAIWAAKQLQTGIVAAMLGRADADPVCAGKHHAPSETVAQAAAGLSDLHACSFWAGV